CARARPVSEGEPRDAARPRASPRAGLVEAGERPGSVRPVPPGCGWPAGLNASWLDLPAGEARRRPATPTGPRCLSLIYDRELELVDLSAIARATGAVAVGAVATAEVARPRPRRPEDHRHQDAEAADGQQDEPDGVDVHAAVIGDVHGEGENRTHRDEEDANSETHVHPSFWGPRGARDCASFIPDL